MGEWRKVMQKLNIKTRENDKVSVAAYLRILEATPLFGNIFEETVQSLKEKINNIFTNPRAFIKSELNGKEHRLIAKHAMDLSPVMALIPTDMGLPLEMELHMPVVASLDTKLSVMAALPKPEFRMDTRLFLSTQITGWVGTVIPFTKEVALVALDNTVVYNLPASIKINIDMPKQHLKMSVSLDKQLNKATDLVHHHAHPFSVIQKVEDFTPITLSANMKIIESGEQLKKVERIFGESLGLHLHVYRRTESRYVDLQSIIERAAIFNYNPLTLLMFPTDMALNPAGTLSLRRNEHCLRIDPTQSTTKALSVDFVFGYASKIKDVQAVKYHKLKILSAPEQEQRVEQEPNLILKQLKKLLPVSLVSEPVENKSLHPERQERIEKVMAVALGQSPSVQWIQAINIFTCKIIATMEGGRRPLSWSYVGTFLRSLESIETPNKKWQTNWFIDARDDQTQGRIILKGRTVTPTLSNAWDIHALRSMMIDSRLTTGMEIFRGNDFLWSIKSDTKAMVSHEQKEYSRTSPEAVLCQKLTQRKEAGEAIIAKLSEPCEIMRQQALALDEIQITVQYKNVPAWVEFVEAMSVEIFKTIMWPFLKLNPLEIKPQTVGKPIKTFPVYARIQFRKDTPSFDLTIERPMGKVQMGQVRLPYPLNLVMPLKAGLNNFKLASKLVSANTLLPVCKVEGKALQTFDNRSLPLIMDPCFHLVAADCSNHGRFSVQARELPTGQKDHKIIVGKTMIDIITVPGSPIEVRMDREPDFEVVKSEKTVEIYAPQYSLQSLIVDRERALAIEINPLVVKSHMCGLCGNFNMQHKDDLQGPQTCMYSKPEVEAAAYRISDSPVGCEAEKPLAQNIKDLLQKESTQCLKKVSIPTKISKSLKTQTGQCTILKHAVLRRPGQICISKKAVTQCAAGCQPSQPELLEKQIPFTCLKEDRVAQRYLKKADRAERLAEIEVRPTTFETKVPQPRTCVPASNEL